MTLASTSLARTHSPATKPSRIKPSPSHRTVVPPTSAVAITRPAPSANNSQLHRRARRSARCQRGWSQVASACPSSWAAMACARVSAPSRTAGDNTTAFASGA
jgi:hypothetical protein